MAVPTFRPLRPRLAVVAGGMVGSTARFWLQETASADSLPWGTLTANVVGSFALGYLATRLAGSARDWVAPLLAVGLLGGLTTFSGLIAEVWALELRAALLYGSLTVIAGLGAALLGTRLARGRA